MDWMALLLLAAPAVLTFLLGLFANKPGYKKGKNVAKAILNALDDDKLTAEEIKAILNAFNTK